MLVDTQMLIDYWGKYDFFNFALKNLYNWPSPMVLVNSYSSMKNVPISISVKNVEVRGCSEIIVIVLGHSFTGSLTGSMC